MLETPRLRLRRFVEDDFDAYAEITADPEVMRYVSGSPFSREEARSSLDHLLGHWRVRGYGLWAAEERWSGELVGRIGLYRPEGWPGLEVGWIVRRDRWGEGLATEGGRASLDWAFGELGAARVISVIEPPNLASIRVAVKLGERFDRPMQLAGKGVHIYAIDRSTWESG